MMSSCSFRRIVIGNNAAYSRCPMTIQTRARNKSTLATTKAIVERHWSMGRFEDCHGPLLTSVGGQRWLRTQSKSNDKSNHIGRTIKKTTAATTTDTPPGAQYHLPIMLQPIAAATARTATAEEQAVPAALATYSSLAAARLETMAAKIDTLDAKLNAAKRFRRGWMAAISLILVSPFVAFREDFVAGLKAGWARSNADAESARANRKYQ